jgi:hypothetical protein
MQDRKRGVLTHAQALAAVANIADGFCPFEHGPLRDALCETCSALEGYPVRYWAFHDQRGPSWTDDPGLVP